MGTVHGVYLKYVGLSSLSYIGYRYFMRQSDTEVISMRQLIGIASKAVVGALLTLGSESRQNDRQLDETQQLLSIWKLIPGLVLGYSTILNGVIAVLFKLEWGMHLLGKDPTTGQIPWWSYLIFFPFHGPTLLYTHVHTNFMQHQHRHQADGRVGSALVPVATQVQPGWWVGGCYAHRLHMQWAAVIDLTVEFPESCITQTAAYLSLPTWDGVPATPAQLEQAAAFAVDAMAQSYQQGGNGGDVLVHCAHGRGRSTTVMCACLVKAGLYAHWHEALEVGIRPQRSVCKLNQRMRQALQAWQDQYVDNNTLLRGDHWKKGQ